jgi:hypothetical protein
MVDWFWQISSSEQSDYCIQVSRWLEVKHEKQSIDVSTTSFDYKGCYGHIGHRFRSRLAELLLWFFVCPCMKPCQVPEKSEHFCIEEPKKTEKYGFMVSSLHWSKSITSLISSSHFHLLSTSNHVSLINYDVDRVSIIEEHDGSNWLGPAGVSLPHDIYVGPGPTYINLHSDPPKQERVLRHPRNSDYTIVRHPWCFRRVGIVTLAISPLPVHVYPFS